NCSATRARAARSSARRRRWRSPMPEAFEYAIKKDVRNNPIVREVDEAKQRELWKSVSIAGLLVAVLLFSAWQHFELLRHGYQIEEMQKQKAAEEETARRLRLEIDTLKNPKRIETLATEKLHLVAPTKDEAIVIERVKPVEPPAKSVIARRKDERHGGSGVAIDAQTTGIRRRGAARPVGRRHRSTARLPAGREPHRSGGPRRAAAETHAGCAGQTRRHSRSARPRAGDERRRR